jgi:signal transduction histidine kinase
VWPIATARRSFYLACVKGVTQAWERIVRLDMVVVDTAIAVALTVVTQVEIGASHPAAHAALLLTLSLAARRRAPLAVALLAATAVAAQGLAANPPSVFGEYVAVTLAIYTVAADAALRPAVLGGLAIVAGIVLHDLRSREYGSAGGIASDLMTPVVFWAVGRAVRLTLARARAARTDAERANAQSAELARQAVEDERRHIARELHDIVTHSLGVIVLQAQGAGRALEHREPTIEEALATIEHSGRSALEEMRRLLGLLRDDGERPGLSPQPRLAQADELVRRVNDAGLPVRLRVEGEPVALESGVDLSAYRVLQEALTNSLKHARGARAEVTIRYRPTKLELEVTDDGGSDGNGNSAIGGARRGLLGMRERVSFYGGTLEHGPQPGGGFRVHATFPARRA